MFHPDAIKTCEALHKKAFKRLVFLDADTWVRSSRIRELLEPHILTEDMPLAAVMDVSYGDHPADAPPGKWNSGVMVFRPDLNRFTQTYGLLMAGYTNDQPAINEAFENHVAQLDPACNTHAHMVEKGLVSAEEVVVVHFTGSPKPTYANASHIARLRRGEVYDQTYGLRGAGHLYGEFFAEMARPAVLRLLSSGLQSAIRKVRGKRAEHSPT